MTNILKATALATLATFAISTTSIAASHAKKGSAAGETMKKDAMAKDAKGSTAGDKAKKQAKGSTAGEAAKKQVKGSAKK